MLIHEIYARSFYESLAEDWVSMYTELLEFNRILEIYPQVRSQLLLNPGDINEIAYLVFENVSQITKRFLLIIIEDHMIDHMTRICLSYRDLMVNDKLWNVCIIECSSEKEVALVDKIKTRIDNFCDGVVEYKIIINPALIAGYTVYFNNQTFDFSINARLSRVVEEVSHG